MTQPHRIPPPEVLALVVADAVHRDGATGKCYILGTFSTIFSTNFPCTHGLLTVYAALSNGHGRRPITLRLIDEDEERPPLFEHMAGVVFPDPLTVVEMSVLQANVVFPMPGRYSVQLRCDGELLRERRLLVQRPNSPPPPSSA